MYFLRGATNKAFDRSESPARRKIESQMLYFVMRAKLNNGNLLRIIPRMKMSANGVMGENTVQGRMYNTKGGSCSDPKQIGMSSI